MKVTIAQTGQHTQGIEVTEEMILAVKQVCNDYGFFNGGYPNEETIAHLVRAVLDTAKAHP
jgi:hypothetical protein